MGVNMSKKMIDADVLLSFAKKQLEISRYAIDSSDTNFQLKDTHKGCVIILEAFIEKINELATPAPEPQESIFDAHAFNLKEESRHSQYWRPNDILISNQDTTIKLSADNFNCHKLRKLRNITAEQRCLYSKICELADRLDEKIQRENIFDADGWCWDASKAPETEVILLYKSGAVIDGCVTPLKNIKAWRPLPTPPKAKS
jgi:hypothetical protein